MKVTNQMDIKPGNILTSSKYEMYSVLNWNKDLSKWNMCAIEPDGTVIKDKDEPVIITMSQDDLVKLEFTIK